MTPTIKALLALLVVALCMATVKSEAALGMTLEQVENLYGPIVSHETNPKTEIQTYEFKAEGIRIVAQIQNGKTIGCIFYQSLTGPWSETDILNMLNSNGNGWIEEERFRESETRIYRCSTATAILVPSKTFLSISSNDFKPPLEAD